MNTRTKQSGFTLVEMMVSLAVFATVITIAVGALLVLVATSESLQEEQNVMTNLAFALDSMTREIRTGTEYYCDSLPTRNGANNIFSDASDLDDVLDGIPFGPTQDCSGRTDNHHGISFIESGDSITGSAASRIVYFFDSTSGQLLRKVGSDPAASIVSSNIYIHDVNFFVSGAAPQSAGGGEDDQASVTIFIDFSPTSTTPSTEWYVIQTTVTQRTLDI